MWCPASLTVSGDGRARVLLFTSDNGSWASEEAEVASESRSNNAMKAKFTLTRNMASADNISQTEIYSKASGATTPNIL